MRIDTDNWSVSSAVKIGHHHLYKGANCQDTADFFVSDDIICGVGCDGCGEGLYSEIGARMLCNFALSEIARLHQMKFSPEEKLTILFGSLIRFIDMQVYLSCPLGTPQQIAYYIKHHWLTTIMGFIINEKEGSGVIFHCGDGVYSCKDNITIDQSNAPRYIAYNCLRDPQLVGVESEMIPTNFETKFFGASINRIMVASDGFDNHNEQKLILAMQKDSELTWDLHEQQWGKRGNFGLKKWMNSRSDRGYFDDDCFIITAERKCQKQ